MPRASYTEDEDAQAYSGWTISALEGAANREFRAGLQGRLDSLTSVRQKFDRADIDSLREASRDLARQYAAEFNPEIKKEILAWSDTVSQKASVSARQLTYLKKAYGLDPLDWPKKDRRPKKEDVFDLSAQPILFGSARGLETYLGTESLRGEAAFSGDLKDDTPWDGTLKGDAFLSDIESRGEMDADPYPVMPKRRATLVDSLSVISLLNQPRPFTVDQVDEMFLRIGKKDPFAAAAFGEAKSGTVFPKWMISEATAKEAKRIINEELGVDLTYQGQDFAMPADWMHRDGPTVKLDPAKQRLVDGLMGWAVANAKANKLSSAFSVDPGSAFGVTWTDRRYRAEQGAVMEAVGVAQGAIGRELSPYMLDVKDPILSMLFPDGRPNGVESHPVQEYMREAGDFLLSWLLPGTNVRDIQGRHWVPKDIRPTVYSTINNMRFEFGAPQMGTILDDNARIMPVSFLKNVSPENYTRGWFGFNPGGKDILDWQKIRNAKESMEIMDPVLSPTSSPSRFSFIGGRLMDAYSGKELNIEDAYNLRSIEWNEKKGKWDISAPRVSQYQLDHMLPLAYLWEHGYAQIADKIRHEFVDQPNGGTPGSVLSALRGDALYLSAPIQGGGFMDDTKVMQALQFMARAGMAANPDQFHLVASKLNQEKGAKGPGGWMPFLFANRPEAHAVNVEYVRAWRSVVASERKAFAETFGHQDPNFLREDREDRLAMRRVDLGLDQTGRWTRWAADAYVNYFDSPNLQDPALYQRIRATAAIAEAKMAFGLSVWAYSPVNQLYLRGRRYIVDGFGKAFFDNPGTSFKDKSAIMWKWVRDRQAGVPFLGTSRAPKIGEDAIYTLHDIVRSGKVENIVDNSTGEVVHAFTGKVYAADPKSIWRYVGGEENAFGPDVIRDLRATESGFIPGYHDLVRESYRAHLAGDIHAISPAYMQRQFLSGRFGEFPVTAAQQQHWFKELGKWESLYSEMHGPLRPGEKWLSLESRVEDIFVNKSLLRGARETVRSGYSFTSTSQLGQEQLRVLPFVEEIGDLFRAGKFKEAYRKTTLELLVKVADYGLKGSLGVMEQLPAILGIEAFASKGATAMKPMTVVRPDYAHYDFSEYGGFFGWYKKINTDARSFRDASRETTLRLIREARAARLERIAYSARWNRMMDFSTRAPDVLRRDLAHLESLIEPVDFHLREANRLRRRLAEMESFSTNSYLEFAAHNDQSAARELALLAELRRSREESFRISSQMKEMARLVDEEAPWINQISRMPGARGAITRFAVQHPRIITNLARVRNLPASLAFTAKAPLLLHAAIAKKIDESNRLFKIIEETDEAGKVTLSRGARMERSMVWRNVNKTASLKGVATGVGGALNALAFIESGFRYGEAKRLASTSWDSLAIDEKASLESYVAPSSWNAMKSSALDVGLPFTPWGLAQGLALSVGNQLGRVAVGARAPQQFHEEHFQNMLFGRPSFASIAAAELDRRHNAQIGILPVDLRFTPKIVNDTSSYISKIRQVGMIEKDPWAKVEKKIKGVHSAWRLIPETDTLGYENKSSMFMQADQYVSDYSLALLPHMETKPVMVRREEAHSRADRAAYLAQQADLRKRSELVHQARVSKGFLQKAWFYLAASSEQSLSGGMANDSLDLLRDLKARDSVRLRK